MAQFAEERDWDQYHSPRNLLLALVCFFFQYPDKKIYPFFFFWFLLHHCMNFVCLCHFWGIPICVAVSLCPLWSTKEESVKGKMIHFSCHFNLLYIPFYLFFGNTIHFMIVWRLTQPMHIFTWMGLALILGRFFCLSFFLASWLLFFLFFIKALNFLKSQDFSCWPWSIFGFLWLCQTWVKSTLKSDFILLLPQKTHEIYTFSFRLPCLLVCFNFSLPLLGWKVC